MNRFNYIITGVGYAGWIITMIILLCVRECTAPHIHVEKTIERYFDSTKHSIDRPVPGPAYSYSVAVPQNVDTAAILQDYFTKNFYTQEFADSNIRATVSDTIFKNHLAWRKFDYKLLKPQTIITNNTVPDQPAEEKKKRALYAGAFATYELSNRISGLGPQIIFQDKRNQAFSLQVNLMNYKQPGITAGFTKKIGK